MARTWTGVLEIYLLIGVVIQVGGMFIPGIRKVFEGTQSQKKAYVIIIVISSLIGVLTWPIALLMGYIVKVRAKKLKQCPGCNSKIILMFCPNCGPVKKSDLLRQEQKDDRIRSFEKIKDPEIRKAAFRAAAEVDANPLITQMKRKMAMLKIEDPERETLHQEIGSTIEAIFSRHCQPTIDDMTRKAEDAHKKLECDLKAIEEERLYLEVEKILQDQGIQAIQDCKECGAEVTLRMEVIPGPPPALNRLAYNCQNCFAMNVVWTAPGIIK